MKDKLIGLLDKLEEILPFNPKLILIAIPIAILIFSFLSSGGITIDSFDSNLLPLDKEGNLIVADYDSSGKLKKIKYTDKALAFLGISENETKYVDPFNLSYNPLGRVQIKVPFPYTSKGVKHETGAYRDINREIYLDEMGEPVVIEGEPVYIDNKDVLLQGLSENNSPTEIGDNPTNKEEQYDPIEVELTEDDTMNIESTEDISVYVTLKDEEEFSVNKLPDVFYSVNPNWTMIKETPYRDMRLIPKSDLDNNFIIYNNTGVLKPYKKGGYINRNLFGIIINYNFLDNCLDYSYQDGEQINPKIDLNKELTLKEIKKSILITQNFKVYKELEDISVDKLSYQIFDIFKTINDDISETYPQKYKNLTKSKYDDYGEKDGKFIYETFIEYKEIQNKLSSVKLEKNTSLNLLYKIYKYKLNQKLSETRKEACIEMNNFEENSCTNSEDISTLEIRSDFMQKIYLDSWKESLDIYYQIATALVR